jgi:hypothetical protein
MELEPELTEKQSWIRRIPPEVPIFLFFFLMTVFLTWPVFRGFNSYVYGIPGDNLGAMWGWWWIRNASTFGGSATFSPLIGYPFGQSFPAVPAEFILEYFARFLLLFFNQTVVYNLLITSSFFLSGVTMYYLVRYITRDKWAAFFGGLAYLVCAYHAVHAFMFVNLAMTQWMPLFILALLVFLKKPGPKNAALLWASGILVAGTCIHYALFMGIFTVSFLFGYFLYRWLRNRHEPRPDEAEAARAKLAGRKALALGLLAAFGIIVVIIPIFTISNQSGNRVGEFPTRPTQGGVRDLEITEAGSASPLAYVIPEGRNFLSGRLASSPAARLLNMWENSLYLGFSLFALAIFAIAIALRREKRGDACILSLQDSESCVSDTSTVARFRLARDEKSITWGLIVAAAAGFIISMPPYIDFGTVRVPLPSMIMRYFAPWLRWYMRAGVIVIICFILLASVGLSLLRRSVKNTVGDALAVGAIIVMVLGMLIVPPFKYFELSGELPPIFQKVAAVSDARGVVIYPAFEPGFFSAQRFLYYQQSFQKPMLNGGWDNSDGEAMRRTIYNPYNPATPGILSSLGISHVVYLDRMFEKYEGTEKAPVEVRSLPPGIELEAQATYNDDFGSGYIFRVTAPKAPLVPVYLGDITTPHIDEGRVTVRLMEAEGTIKLVNYSGKNVEAEVGIPLTNIALSHEISLLVNGELVFSGKLTDKESTVITIQSLLVPPEGVDLRIVVNGPGIELDRGEQELFGTISGTLKVGDVSITPLQ